MRESAVKRFVRRLNYRDKVLERLDALLLCYPPGRRLGRDFPTLRNDIRTHFEAGLAPESAALQLATEIIGSLLRQLGAAERATVRERLRTMQPAELDRLAADRIARRKPEKSDSVTFATRLAGVALFMARRMAETGALRREEHAHLEAAVEAALGDTTSGQ